MASRQPPTGGTAVPSCRGVTALQIQESQDRSEFGHPALGRPGRHPGALAEQERVDIRSGQHRRHEHAIANRLLVQEATGGVLVTQHRARSQTTLAQHPRPVLPKQNIQRRQRLGACGAAPTSRKYVSNGTIARGPIARCLPAACRSARNAAIRCSSRSPTSSPRPEATDRPGPDPPACSGPSAAYSRAASATPGTPRPPDPADRPYAAKFPSHSPPRGSTVPPPARLIPARNYAEVRTHRTRSHARQVRQPDERRTALLGIVAVSA